MGGIGDGGAVRVGDRQHFAPRIVGVPCDDRTVTQGDGSLVSSKFPYNVKAYTGQST